MLNQPRRLLLTVALVAALIAGASNVARASTLTPGDKSAFLKEAAVTYFNSLTPSANMVGADELRRALEAKKTEVFLLDIRPVDEFQQKHIAGFVNIPFTALGKHLDKLPTDRPIMVVCHTGQKSGQVVGVLRVAGYDAISIRGGYPALEAAFRGGREG
ncbi:MAG: rhodanese-like domain-containing protein [Mycobacterium leprae]